MLEIGASGSVGGEGGNILVYPARATLAWVRFINSAAWEDAGKIPVDGRSTVGWAMHFFEAYGKIGKMVWRASRWRH